MNDKLRYYQRDAVDSVYKFCEDNPGRNPCVVLPTGAGKTHVLVQICKDVQSWQGRVLILAHVKELLGQAADKLRAVSSLDVGIFSAGLKRRDTENDIIVAGVQSVYSKGLELCGSRPFNLVIVDEAHRIPTDGEGMYCQLLQDLQKANPKVRVIGLTATPYRTGQGYVCGDDHFLNEVCYEADIKELIAGGYLCSLSSKKSLQEVDMSGVRKSGGDFNSGEMEDRFNDDEKVKPAVDEICKYTADRKKVLIFCCGIAHATNVAAVLDQLQPGSVRLVTSEHSGRDGAIEAFKQGKAKYLVNVNCLTEGFDATAIDCVVLLRATVSPGLYYQMVGRGLRIDPSKKDCLVLDFGGNVQRHGTLDNLKISKKGKGSGEAGESPVKACPDCQEMVHAGLLVCPCCGFEFPPIKPNHEATASSDSPISGGDEICEYRVDSVSYSIHRKKHTVQNPGPPSMRVTYYEGLTAVADEWVCPQHTGFPFEKAYSWWHRRCRLKMPKTVEDAVELANAGELVEPTSIKVRKRPNDFDRIMSYELEPVADVIPAEEVPF